MEVDLSGNQDGIAERFVPDQDRGRLIEVEHVSRYRWAAQAARGRAVLDAGCGAAYGSCLLAEEGAREVIGVDIAESVLDAVAPTMPDNVRLVAGDLRELSFDNDSFGLVVCFEVIEHFENPFGVLDELVRVLAPDGLLIISSPNRGVYQPGNPHHLHEFTASELRAALTSRLTNARLVRQHDYIASALLSDENYGHGDGQPIPDLDVRKLIGAEPGSELYTVAVGSNAEIPELRQLMAMTGTLELRDWLSAFDVQTNAINEKDNYISELEAMLRERDRIAGLLVGAEQRLAEIPDLRLKIADLEFELAEARRAADVARAEAKALDDRLMLGQRALLEVTASPSWRITKPLRLAKRSVNRLRYRRPA